MGWDERRDPLAIDHVATAVRRHIEATTVAIPPGGVVQLEVTPAHVGSVQAATRVVTEQLQARLGRDDFVVLVVPQGLTRGWVDVTDELVAAGWTPPPTVRLADVVPLRPPDNPEPF